MNMMDSRKFRRKRKPLKSDAPRDEDELAPVPPLETRDERLARRAAEEDAQRQAEAESERRDRARRDAEAEAQRQVEEQARLEADLEARRQAAEQARRDADAEAQRIAQEQAKLKAEAKRRAEEQARREAEAQAQRAAEEQARREAEAQAQRAAEEQARRETEAQAQRAAEEQARREAEAQAQRAAEEQARREAEAQAQREAEEQARRDEAKKRAAEARVAARAKRIENARLAEEKRLREQALAARDKRLNETEVARRTQPPLTLPPEARAPAPDLWQEMGELSVDLGHLNRNRIITADRLDPAHTTFDVLRTRLMQALAEKGWKRVAITSPGKDCGKTFTTANLAISMSRQENTRTMVMDFDMRRPSLFNVMGAQSPGALGDVLRGTLEPEEHFLRMGPNHIDAGRNIAFALNTTVEPYASELLQDPRTERALNHIEETFQPDVMLFDLPPALFYDDVIAFRPHFDGVLLVIGGGLTTEREIKDVERRLGSETPLLGMVLNKAEGTAVDRYAY